MPATHAIQSTVPQAPVLYIAIELSLATWKLAFTVGPGHSLGSVLLLPAQSLDHGAQAYFQVFPGVEWRAR
jgi:hypothetical protein